MYSAGGYIAFAALGLWPLTFSAFELGGGAVARPMNGGPFFFGC